MSKTIKALQILGSVDVRVGGPAYSVKNLTEHLNALEVKTDIWTFNYPYQDQKINLNQGGEHFVAPDSFLSRKFAAWNPRAKNHLNAIVSNYDVIHNHGHWLFGNAYARMVSQQMKKPVMISSRGLLEPWALGWRSLKKKLALQLFENENIKAANIFHATSHQEAENMRRFGIKQPIAVIPNGIDLMSATVSAETLSKKQILFLSRIDPKKGLERLFSIWQRQAKRFPEWELVVAGNGCESYMARLKEDARGKGLDSSVRWAGFVQGEDKTKLFNQASAFILPTFSENFGIAIGEALSHGVPVITTNGTPWNEIQTEKCGWYTENNEASIEKALIEALNTPAQALKEMGMRGKALIEKKYTWPNVAKEMVDTYRWMLKVGDKPDCVRID